jgi:hypothetical protein
MNHDLEIALAAARRWRDFGNLILLVGIVAEILIEGFCRDRPSVFTPSWCDHICEPKNVAILIAGLITLAGLWLERTKGQDADDFADQIRTNLEIQDQALTMMATGRRLIVTPDFRKLSAYKGTPTVVTWDMPPDEETAHLTGDLAGDLDTRAKWTIVPTGLADPGLRHDQALAAGTDGVRIATRFLPSDSPFSEGYIPKRLGETPSPRTPDEKAAAAAYLLRWYLTSIGISAEYGEVPTDMLPVGEVHIAVGPRQSSIDPELLANLERTLLEMSNNKE